MRKRSDRERVQDILGATIRIQSYVSSSEEKNFAKDRLRQDAVTRRIEIIGEAARNVSAKFRARHREIPWSQMTEAQDRIHQDHFKIDAQILWDTATNEIPQLKKAVSRLLKELEG